MLIPETEASASHLCQNMCPCAEYWLDLSLRLITWDAWVSLLFTMFVQLLALHCEVDCLIKSMPCEQQSIEVNRGKHLWRQRRKRKPRNQSWSSRDQIKMLPNESLIKLVAHYEPLRLLWLQLFPPLLILLLQDSTCISTKTKGQNTI